MLTALTKRRLDGRPYERRDETTRLLGELLSLSQEDLLSRLSVRDRGHIAYVPSECVVYLLREARRSGSGVAWFDRLFTLLIERCERHLAHAVRYGAVPDAQSAREEVIERFMEALAHGLGPTPEKLDAYEVAFDKAFAALRYDVLRAAGRRRNETALVVSDGEDDGDVAGAIILAQPEAENAMGLLTAQLEIFRKQSDAAIDALPPKEREAIRLLLAGHQIQSDDPEEPTISKLCNVSDRTIRSRLARGADLLTDKLHGDVP